MTVSGSNYGTLSCTSSNTSYATCSVSGTTVTIVPKAVGTATITVTGAGNTNYNSISKTYAATIEAGYKCDTGTLTYDATKGASSGGYICVTNCNSSYGPRLGACIEWCTDRTGCCKNEVTYGYSYSCPSGFSVYSGSGSSMKCYKAATL